MQKGVAGVAHEGLWYVRHPDALFDMIVDLKVCCRVGLTDMMQRQLARNGRTCEEKVQIR